MNNRVACVILNYNDADNVIELVRSIEEYALLDRIIVVDNVSTDDSMERLKMIRSGKVTVCSSGKNGGYGYGNNFGAKIAKYEFGCKYAFIINSDTRCSEENMRLVLRCFDLYPDCGVSSGIQRLSDGTEVNNMAWKIPSATNYALTSLYFIAKLCPKYVTKIEDEYEKVECILGSCFCVDLDKFLGVRGFDENIFLFCEETTLGVRMKQCGYTEYLVRDAFYYHYHEQGSIARNVKKYVRQKKILFASRFYVIKTYLTKSKLSVCFAKCCFMIATAESYIKMWILEICRAKDKD